MDQESVQNNDTKETDGNPHKRYPWLRDPDYKEKAIARQKEREGQIAREIHDRVRPHTCGAWKDLPKQKGK